jgi:hypothetical protein
MASKKPAPQFFPHRPAPTAATSSPARRSPEKRRAGVKSDVPEERSHSSAAGPSATFYWTRPAGLIFPWHGTLQQHPLEPTTLDGKPSFGCI